LETTVPAIYFNRQWGVGHLECQIAWRIPEAGLSCEFRLLHPRAAREDGVGRGSVQNCNLLGTDQGGFFNQKVTRSTSK
jgi:hypothetical protein